MPHRSVLFRIHSGNDNLFFASNMECFQVQKDGTTPDNDAYYTGPLCAWIAGGSVQYGRTAGPGCRVSSFIADAAADQNASPNPQDFFTSFNIYFEIELKWKNGSGKRLLPVIIDPDVGYPGGNTVDPGP